MRAPRAVILAVLGAVLACGRGNDAPQVPLAQAAEDSVRQVEAAHAILGPGAKAALDSGNVLYRARKYPAALAEYRVAADLAPQHPAPLFGVYMVAQATGNTGLADSAMAEIKKRSGPTAAAPHAFTDSALRDLHKKVGAPLPSPKS
jgi:hypothetical protein